MSKPTEPQQLPTFDELVEMAQADPEALSRLRQHMSQAVIDNAPPERRQQLQALQSHIDRKLSLAKNPLHASVMLSEELQRSLMKLQQALNNPTDTTATQQSAAVLDFSAAKAKKPEQS